MHPDVGFISEYYDLPPRASNWVYYWHRALLLGQLNRPTYRGPMHANMEELLIEKLGLNVTTPW